MSALLRLTRGLADTLYAPLSTSPKIWTAVVDPTITDDASPLGVKPGDLWINTATGNEFRNISAANGAAIWRHKPRPIAQGGAQVPLTGTTDETAFVTKTIVANTIGIHGRLEIFTLTSTNNDASGKTLRVRLGGIAGTEFVALASANEAGKILLRVIQNRATAATQVAFNEQSGGFNNTTGATKTGAVDTTANQDLVISGQLADGTDNMNLEAYSIKLFRPDIGPT